MRVVDVGVDARERSARMSGFLRGESLNLVDFLIELAEFDRLKRYEALGYARVGHYCKDELQLEDGQIYYRVSAARIIQRAPFAAEYLRDGRLCLTRIAPLNKVLTVENARGLLDKCACKSTDFIKEVVAGLAPKPEKASGAIRRVPHARVPTPENETPAPQAAPAPPMVVPNPEPDAASEETFALVAQAARPRIEPVAEDRFSLPLRFGREFRDDFERLKVLVGHLVPDGDPLKVIHYAVKRVIAEKEKRLQPPRKLVLSAMSQATRPYIPVDLERAVRERDGHKCVWELRPGKLCGSVWQLEIDHILAIALGGKTEIANLRLLCRAHNQLHARQSLGAETIERAIKRRSRAR